jgi:hypothetical protein
MIDCHISSEGLAELQKSLTSSELKNEIAFAAGRGAANLVRNYLLDDDVNCPNQLGGTRTHFYASAADSISELQLSGGSVSFTIRKVGLAQRVFGGRIQAGVGTSSATGNATKCLAIPAHPIAYGQAPSAFPNLKFIPSRRGGSRAMLVWPMQTAASTRRHTRSVNGLVMYWLVPSVMQKPDPGLLPTDAEVQEAATAEAGRYLSERLP